MTHKLEELAAKAVGAVKAAKATFEGMSGVFRHLVQEHGEASALLMRLKLTNDPAYRQELWTQVRAELLAHEEAEMREVYPALREDPQTAPMVAEHDDDAEDMRNLIAKMTEIGVESTLWQTALERLISMVQEHVRDEEEEYFPIADSAFKDRSDEMLERFEKTKAFAKQNLLSVH